MVENPPVDPLTENNSPSDMHHGAVMEDMELCVSLQYSVLDVTQDQPYYGQNSWHFIAFHNLNCGHWV